VDKVLAVASAYILGSIPIAYIVSRTIKGIDIRRVGDKNPGAANVFRHIGLYSGIIVLSADIAKGALAMFVAQAISGDWFVRLVAGGAAVIGHSFPVFLRFRGGRGEATTIGVLLLLIPREMAITSALTITLLITTTRNTLWCSAALFAPLPLLCWAFGEPLSSIIYSAALPSMVGLRHFATMRYLPPEARKEASRFWVRS
jgi:glycerol-3-phosphate acyltransferase PlsY